MIKKIIQNYWEVFTIFLLSLTPLLWLRHGEVILGHDSGYRLDPFGYLQTLWYSWDHSSGFGVDVTGSKGFLIAQLPEALLVRLTHSLSLGQTLSFVFWFFIIGISMYVCVRAFFPDRKYWIMRLLSSVGYMYNLFLLQGWFITERAKFSLFAALPILVAVSWNTFSKRYTIFFGSVLIASWQALNFSKGEALILSATILWAIENVVAKIVLKKISSEVVVWARMFFGSIVLLLILFFQGKISLLFTPSHPQLVSVCVGGLFLLGYVLTWYKALKYAPATVVSSILVVSVVITNFLSSIFITNAFSKAQVLSSVIIVVGAFFVKLKPVYELSRPYNLH